MLVKEAILFHKQDSNQQPIAHATKWSARPLRPLDDPI